MSMMWDKKKNMDTIMQRRRGESGGAVISETPMKPEISLDEGGEIDGKHMAAEDMIEAFHAKSADRLKEAMGNFIDLHTTETEPDAED